MTQLLRAAMVAAVALLVSACQGNKSPKELDLRASGAYGDWSGNYNATDDEDEDEPDMGTWGSQVVAAEPQGGRIDAIRRRALGIAPAGVDIERLSSDIGKRGAARIDCIPVELTMILNTVGWHFGQHVHIQSGYRSKNHNRSVGGARGSYHLTCQAVDIQVEGVDKQELARFLKTLPGTGGVGTYCGVSTVHVDIGPKRSWHYGCGRRSPNRYARASRRRG